MPTRKSNGKTDRQRIASSFGLTRGLIMPFAIITCCFALWGFANDVTNPMVKSFSRIFRMTVTDGTLVQVAFYGGYFAMALPAALFVRRHSYKAGLLMGLGLYAVGALAFLPAARLGSYYPFLLAYFVLTCGLSFLETSANPFILNLGTPAQATRRLNLAQAFNPMGSLAGMWVALHCVQARMSPLSSAERAALPEADFEAVKAADLGVVAAPYAAIGAVIAAVLLLMVLVPMPKPRRADTADTRLGAAIGRLAANRGYRRGVVAQFFYVGAQIACWTFIIQLGTRVYMADGLTEQAAEMASQRLNIVAMALFCASRFACTLLMRFFRPGPMLALFSLAAMALVLGVIVLGGHAGLYCLVAVSACMSLMFPTIYGLALGSVGEDTELGSAGLIMAILGGSLIPPLQALIMDGHGLAGLAPERLSFVVPLACFAVVAAYAFARCRQAD